MVVDQLIQRIEFANPQEISDILIGQHLEVLHGVVVSERSKTKDGSTQGRNQRGTGVTGLHAKILGGTLYVRSPP